MTEAKSTADWLSDWQALQQRHWASMGDLARRIDEQARAVQASGVPKWHEGLEIWSRIFQGGRDDQSEVVERALAHGKAYLELLQRMGDVAARRSEHAGPQDWAVAFADLMQGMLPGFSAPGLDALHSATTQGARGIEQMMADLQPMLSLFLGELRSVLGVQPFGLTREHQERQQALAVAVLDYQQASARHQALLGKALQRGIEIFEHKLAERSEPGHQVESPKALYDLWIDAAEEGYAEVALSEDFQDAYGALINTQMRVRQLLQHQIERLGATLGMPTRAEINSMHRKLAALRRLQGESTALRELSAEVARLRARIEGDEEAKKVRVRSAAKQKPAVAKKQAPGKAAPVQGHKTPSRAIAKSGVANRQRKPSR